MAESTLSISYPTLLRRVGDYLGYTGTYSQWTTAERQDVEDCVQDGLRRFYAPPPVGDDPYGHKWSFLYPLITLTAVAGTEDYLLPDHIMGIDGCIHFRSGSTTYEIRIVGEGQILSLRNTIATSQKPQCAAVSPLPPKAELPSGSPFTALDYSGGTRFALMLYPAPDAAYVMTYRGMIIPEQLDESNPYPYGGQVHGQTILQACLAEAEANKDREEGIQNRRFMERLHASVSHDKRNNSPDYLGYNGESSVYPTQHGGRYQGPLKFNYNGTRIIGVNL